jgi:hypothetical protein
MIPNSAEDQTGPRNHEISPHPIRSDVGLTKRRARSPGYEIQGLSERAAASYYCNMAENGDRSVAEGLTLQTDIPTLTRVRQVRPLSNFSTFSKNSKSSVRQLVET